MGPKQTFDTAQIDTFFAEYTKSIEGFVALGRQAIERATLQNGDVVAAWKNGLDVVAEGWQKSAQAQRDLAAVAVERVQTVARLVTQNVESVTKTVSGVAAAFDVYGGFAATVQKQAVELVAAQKTAIETTTQQIEASGNAALETFQRGVDTLIEAQKSVLRASQAA